MLIVSAMEDLDRESSNISLCWMSVPCECSISLTLNLSSDAGTEKYRLMGVSWTENQAGKCYVGNCYGELVSPAP